MEVWLEECIEWWQKKKRNENGTKKLIHSKFRSQNFVFFMQMEMMVTSWPQPTTNTDSLLTMKFFNGFFFSSFPSFSFVPSITPLFFAKKCQFSITIFLKTQFVSLSFFSSPSYPLSICHCPCPCACACLYFCTPVLYSFRPFFFPDCHQLLLSSDSYD